MTQWIPESGKRNACSKPSKSSFKREKALKLIQEMSLQRLGLSYSVCSIYTHNMNIPCQNCTYSYSLIGYTRISIIFQTFCFLYFKSIFIKTITSFLFGDVFHKPRSFILFKWYIVCIYIIMVYSNKLQVG